MGMIGRQNAPQPYDVYKKDEIATLEAIQEATLVHNTGNEIIDDIKTFTSSPIVPDPTTAQEAASKNYVDTKPAGFKNKLINGLLNINQRAVTGTVVLGAGVYGHDRYKAGASGCTYTFATVENVTTITITAGSLIHVVEGLNLVSGIHTLSWVGTSQCKIDTGAYGNSGISATLVGGTNATVEVGIGTFTKHQLEEGSVATPFEQRPYGLELALCQRYYERSSVIRDFMYLSNPVLYQRRCQIRFKTTKRVTPTTVATYETNGTYSVAPNVQYSGVDSISFVSETNENTGAVYVAVLTWSSTAEL